jgi:hypothetical protein
VEGIGRAGYRASNDIRNKTGMLLSGLKPQYFIPDAALGTAIRFSHQLVTVVPTSMV